MKTQNKAPYSRVALSLVAAAITTSAVTSCVVEAPPPRRVVVERPFVEGRVIEVLPVGGRYVVYRGERCYFHNGVYYRRHPHRRGWIVIR